MTAVLFDLGNTLAAYYHSDEFPPILAQAVAGVLLELETLGHRSLDHESVLARALAENREAADHRVTPMRERLERIFDVSAASDPALSARLCERFLEPILALGRVYDDAVPVLTVLRDYGCRTAIVSNLPWGSPPEPWRRELSRLGLAELVDAVVLCTDVGWRKPGPQIFLHAASALGATCGECVFVGDDPVWDGDGAAAVGMRPVLLDRGGRHADYRGERVATLRELPALLDAGNGAPR